MDYLSLFSGVEGTGIAFQHFLKFKCRGYVEIDNFCQKIIKLRQKEKLLDEAPIFSNIRTFISEGYAEQYKGMVDLITAGFPCQPFSVAGKQEGENDPRNMWPETINTIRLVRPTYAFLENVPGLLASGYMPRIFADLAEAGYNARWTVLGCDNIGGFHRRKRVWILATNSNCNRFQQRSSEKRRNNIPKIWNTKKKVNIKKMDSSNEIPRSNESINVANYGGKRIQRIFPKKIPRIYSFPWRKDVRRVEDFRKRANIPEPLIRRMDNGIPNYVDRIKAIGNAQVPQVAATAWLILKD